MTTAVFDTKKLLDMGFEPAGGGRATLSGPALRLMDVWRAYLRRAFEPYRPTVCAAPPWIAEETLATAKYLANFPHQLTPAPDAPDGGGERYAAPAACLHLYPQLAEAGVGPDGYAALIEGRCSRREGGEWRFPFRLAEFHMLELVLVGDAGFVEGRRAEVERTMAETLGSVGLGGRFEPATDAFFLGVTSGAQMMQKLKGLKREYIVSLGEERVAICSLNAHEDYFGRAFGIESGRPPGPAHSLCAAFGLERLVACCLALWGADSAHRLEELSR
ncbi:MAG: hypothetical protein WKH64_06770 [Chloroflexia bacterium]